MVMESVMDCRLLPGSCMSSCDLVFVVHFVVRCIREIQPRKIIVHACLQLLHVLCACVSRVRSLSLYSFSLPLTLVSLLVRPLKVTFEKRKVYVTLKNTAA